MTAACRVLGAVTTGCDLDIDDSFPAERLLEQLASWVQELLDAGQEEVLHTFMRHAARHEDRVAGIASLLLSD